MKKFLLAAALFLVLLIFFPQKASAKISCPSAQMFCTSLDAAGGCEDPCLRVITGGTGGGRGGQSECQCQEPINSGGTIPEGGVCQTRDDCVPTANYCWAEPGQSSTCHSLPPGTYPTPSSQTPGSANQSESPTCDNGNGINTAIGCIPFNDTNALMGFILRWAIGIGGGIAFLLIIYAGFMIMTSSGNPERLKAGQELLTSAIAGLIMLIFSVFILKFIGVDILKLPGLS